MYTITSDNDNTDGYEIVNGEYDRIQYLHFEDGTVLIINAEPILRIVEELERRTKEIDQ
jgi:hypothetical protein